MSKINLLPESQRPLDIILICFTKLFELENKQFNGKLIAIK